MILIIYHFNSTLCGLKKNRKPKTIWHNLGIVYYTVIDVQPNNKVGFLFFFCQQTGNIKLLFHPYI